MLFSELPYLWQDDVGQLRRVPELLTWWPSAGGRGRVALRGPEPAEDVVAEPHSLDEQRADLVVLADPAPRTGERVWASFGLLDQAAVVITEVARLLRPLAAKP